MSSNKVVINLDTMQNTNNHVKQIHSWLRQHSFLLRLLITTLIAGSIPLIIISSVLISREKNNINMSANQQMSSISELTAKQFDNYIEAMAHVNLKMQTSDRLFERVITSSVQNEIEAIEFISFLRGALPFVYDFGLFINEYNSVYSNSGKYKASVYARYVIGVEEYEFAGAMQNTYKHRFVTWNGLTNNMIYVMPIRAGSSTVIKRVGVYVISPASFISSLDHILSNQYKLAAIYDTDNNAIFMNNNCPFEASGIYETNTLLDISGRNEMSYLVYSSYSSNGYRLILYSEKSSYMKNTENISKSIRAMTIANIIICFCLIVLAVMLNYKSFRTVMNKIRRYGNSSSQSPNNNEFQYILSAFNGQAEENAMLKNQLYDQKALMLDQILENILSGKNVSAQNLAQVKFDMPYLYVVNMNLRDIRNVTSLINKSSQNFYAIEMYADGLFSIIFAVNNPSENAKEKALKIIREGIDQPNICIGCSSVYTEPEKLFLAYLEAARALERNTNQLSNSCDIYCECKLPDDETQPTTKLTYALKIGDNFALDYAIELFDKLVITDNPPSVQRYACYQIIDLYREVCISLGIDLDMTRISLMLQNSDVSLIKKEFIDMISERCDKQSKHLAEALEITYSKVFQFISQKYTDPMFSMNDIADNFGLSIYAASRMLKNILGINFRKYLNELRIEYAKDLLISTDHSINEIAEKSGFTSASYFISIFKSSENVTPNKYRSQR